MLPIAKHWKCVTILVTSAEVCIAAVLGVAQMGQGHGEDFIHLGWKQTKEAQN